MFSLQEHLTWASNLTATHFKNQIVVRGKVRQPATFDNRFGHREGAHELTVPVLVLRPPSAPSRPLWSTTRIGSVFLDSFVITFTQLKRYAGPAQGAIRTIAEYLNRVNKWAPGCVSGYRLLVQIADKQAGGGGGANGYGGTGTATQEPYLSWINSGCTAPRPGPLHKTLDAWNDSNAGL